MRNVFVFDIDGVLSIPDPERLALIRPDGQTDWAAFYACNFLKDGYRASAWSLVKAVTAVPLAEIVLMTSRSESARQQTVAWISQLIEVFFPFPPNLRLIMRRPNDERPAHVIKPEYLAASGCFPENVALVLDDEVANVSALTAAGYCAALYNGGM